MSKGFWSALTTIWIVLQCLVAENVTAKDIHLGGLIFSDEDSSIILHDGWGTGSREDPFVLIEDIVHEGQAILKIHGLREKHRGQLVSRATAGFSLTKIVTNRTRRRWDIFELELREQLDHASTYGDGLSFAQSKRGSRLYESDRFAEAWQTDEPLDAVTFSGATIHPGEQVSVHVVVTDFSPKDEFFLIQRRQAPLALLEE